MRSHEFTPKITGVLYIGAADIPGADDHEGYVSGLGPDGRHTDIWTDVRSAATSTAYAPACECGWRGTAVHPPGPDGYLAAQRTWVQEHFARLDAALPVLAALGHPLCPDSDFLPAR